MHMLYSASHILTSPFLPPSLWVLRVWWTCVGVQTCSTHAERSKLHKIKVDALPFTFYQANTLFLSLYSVTSMSFQFVLFCVTLLFMAAIIVYLKVWSHPLHFVSVACGAAGLVEDTHSHCCRVGHPSPVKNMHIARVVVGVLS